MDLTRHYSALASRRQLKAFISSTHTTTHYGPRNGSTSMSTIRTTPESSSLQTWSQPNWGRLSGLQLRLRVPMIPGMITDGV